MTKFPSELGKQRYCILPARAPYDDRLGLTTLRVLMAIAIFTNSHGIAWPSRITLAKIVGRHVSTISRHTRKLEELEYLRKLQPRKYPIPRRTNHHWSTARYQVLFEGAKTKLPSKEQFKAAKPVIRTDDEAAKDTRQSDQGVRGKETQYRAIAQAFAAGVARASGQHRIADQNLDEAARLAARGVEPAQVTDYAEQMTLEALEAGRPAPLTLKQVAAWAGLD